MRIRKQVAAAIAAVMLICLTVQTSAYGSEGAMTLKWRRSFGYASYSRIRKDATTVTDAEGNAYIIDKTGFINCIAPDNTLIYRANVYQSSPGSRDEAETGSSAPAVDSRLNAYVGSGDGNVYALNPDGTLRWKYHMEKGVTPRTWPVLSPKEDRLYVTDRGGTVYAISTEGGDIAWKSGMSLGSGCSTPALSPEGDMIYVASISGIAAYTAEDTDTGIKAYEWMMRPEADSEGRQTVFFNATISEVDYMKELAVNEDGSIYGVSYARGVSQRLLYLHRIAPDGSEMWRIPLGAAGTDATPPAFHGGYAYYKTSEGKVFAADLSADAPEPVCVFDARMKTGGKNYRAPYISDDGVLYVYLGNQIYALSVSGEKAEVLRSASGAGDGMASLSSLSPDGSIYAVNYKDSQAVYLSRYSDMAVVQDVADISFDHSSAAMRTGSSWTPEVKVTDSSGFDMSRNAQVTFTSSDESVLRAAGKSLEAVSAGTATLTATAGDKAVQMTIRVTEDISGARMEIADDEKALGIGDRRQLTAAAYIGEDYLAGEGIRFVSRHESIAAVTDSGMVTAVAEGTAKIEAYLTEDETVSDYTAVYVEKAAIAKVTHEEIKAAIEKSLAYYRERQSTDDWEAFNVNALGADVNTVMPEYVSSVKNNLKASGGVAGGMMTDYERITVGLVSAGQDVTNFVYDDETGDSIDFIAEIHRGAGGGLGQGINAAIWGLVALNAADYDEADYSGEGYIYNKDYLVNYLIQPGNMSGPGWAFGSGAAADPDMTGMALYALAPYRDRPEVKAAGEGALDWLRNEAQLSNGRFGSWGTVNSCSTSQSLMGILAWGIDPQDESSGFVKANGNAMTALMSYYLGDGTFAYTVGYDPAFGTKQSIQGLAAINSWFENQDNPVESERRSKVWENIAYAGGDVKVSSISLSPGSIILAPKDELELSVISDRGSIVSSMPEEAAKMTWDSTDTAVVTVDGGRVTAVAPGEAYIDVYYDMTETFQVKAQMKVIVRGRDNLKVVKSTGSFYQPEGTKAFAYEVTNTSDSGMNGTFMINLFKVEKYTGGKTMYTLTQQSYVSMYFEPDSREELAAAFDVPEDGTYEVRVMFWNSMSQAQSLVDALTVKEVR